MNKQPFRTGIISLKIADQELVRLRVDSQQVRRLAKALRSVRRLIGQGLPVVDADVVDAVIAVIHLEYEVRENGDD